jgi:hypothetical protein
MGSQRYNFEDAITNMFIEYTESAITEVELNELTNEVRNSIRNIIIRRATEADLSAQLAVEQARELVQRAINQNHINQNHIVPINILSPSIAMRSMPQFVDILTEETEETEEIEETELISKIEMVEEEVLNKEGCSICMDYHKKDDSIKTDCGHIFGLNCYKDWFNAPNGNKSCPYCRKYCPIITIYKMQSDK